MKVKRIYEETTDNGLHKCIEQANGVTVKILREPSKAYKDKMAVKAAAEAVKRAEQDEINAIRKKINDEKERQARESLLASGKLTQDEVDKIGG